VRQESELLRCRPVKIREALQHFIGHFGFLEQGAPMNLQNGFKLLLAAAVAVCWVLPADAQSVTTEVTGDIQSFQGGWVGNGSEIGKSVTLDFAYDSGALTSTLTNTLYIQSAALTSARIVGGVFGAGKSRATGPSGRRDFLDLTPNSAE
jgi:hypothetical protein